MTEHGRVIEDPLEQRVLANETLRGLLADQVKLDAVIREEMVQVRDLFGDDRRTEIAPEAASTTLACSAPRVTSSTAIPPSTLMSVNQP